VKKRRKGTIGTLSKLFSLQRSSRENFADLNDTLLWTITLVTVKKCNQVLSIQKYTYS